MKKPFRLQCVQTSALLKRFASKEEALEAQNNWPDDMLPVRVVKVKWKKIAVVAKVVRESANNATTKHTH